MRIVQDNELRLISAGNEQNCDGIGPLSEIDTTNKNEVACKKAIVQIFVYIAIPLVIVVCCYPVHIWLWEAGDFNIH